MRPGGSTTLTRLQQLPFLTRLVINADDSEAISSIAQLTGLQHLQIHREDPGKHGLEAAALMPLTALTGLTALGIAKLLHGVRTGERPGVFAMEYRSHFQKALGQQPYIDHGGRTYPTFLHRVNHSHSMAYLLL